MRRFLYLKMIGLLLATALFSCQKDKVVDEKDFSATLRENFTDPTKNRYNVQVNDFVPYEITISDAENKPDTEFRLVPLRESNQYHQTLGTDYTLFVNENTPVTTYLSFLGGGKHTFLVQPLVPGTFKHTYELQKWKNGVQIGEAKKLNLGFNAVKINVEYIRYFFTRGWVFSIEDGTEPTDDFFSGQGATYEYSFKLLTKQKRRYSREGKFLLVFSRVHFFDNDDLADGDELEWIEKVQITKKIIGQPSVVVEYHNISVNQKDK
ncbi:hypothetical protein [Capnocytophaga canimorsus]|uniref:hypothetical protein n=1 Tax=Capnocytophaga canimorsus TaxID=28188 RepID=UPI001562407A|nr:hypothetical protein [Capnocytophaga canimorsus]